MARRGEAPASSGIPAWPASGTLAEPLRLGRGIAEPVLGLRLLALAVVAGSGTLLPIDSLARPQLLSAILAGAGLGVAQYFTLRAGRRLLGEGMIPAHVAVWSWLLVVSGGERSPLFVGYLLEVALSGVAFRRRGAVVAALAGFAAYLWVVLRDGAPADVSLVATVGGFLAVGTVLTWIIVEMIERQRRRLHEYHRALHERAATVAEELRLLGDYLGGALVGIDALGRIVNMNPACARLLGFDPARMTGEPWQALIEADEEGRRAIAGTLSEGTARRGLRMSVRHAEGREVAVEAELWVSPSPEGRRTYLLLAPPADAPGGADPFHRLGEAAALVAHQIKNSLHALQGFAAEIRRESGEGSAERENADQLLRIAGSLGALSEDVLAMAGASRPKSERVPLGEVISSAAVLTRRSPGRLALDLPAEDLRVSGHRGQIVHALFNLLDNATRVTPAGERVQVRLRREAGGAAVEISDAGPGLPPGLANGEAPVASSNGSGFGLLAARRFIEGNGGTLTFGAGPAGGTVCRVVFPFAEPAGPGTEGV